MRAVAVVALLLASCTPELGIDPKSSIVCTGAADCPSGWRCLDELHRCLPNAVDPPRLHRTFIVPQDGETNVSTSSDMVMAFSVPARATSDDGTGLADHLTLTALDPGGHPTGDPVPLAVSEVDGNPNTLRVSHPELSPQTQYRLGLSGGVGTLDPNEALPSVDEDDVTFTTGDHRDNVKPGPVTAVLVDRVAKERADLSWTRPTDADLAGVLVVRKAGAKVVASEFPVDGKTYAVGAKLGPDGAEVAAAIDADHVSNVDLSADYYDFVFFAYDTSANYSAPARAPFVSAETLGWCADKTGTFSLASPDPGQQSLLLAPLGTTSYTPMFSSPLGSLRPFDGTNDVATSTFYTSRYVAAADGNEQRGVPTVFIASDPELRPQTQPSGATGGAIGVGIEVIFGFRRYGWADFEAAYDDDPAPGAETWVATTVNPPATGNSVRHKYLTAGSYRLRLRVKGSGGCGDGPWVTSDEFTVGGGARYVSAVKGSDTNDGKSRFTPYATIEKAIADANGTATLDIFVAEGSYTPKSGASQGLLVDKKKVRLFGGYSTDFSSRDGALLGPAPQLDVRPLTHETIITGQLDSAPYDGQTPSCLAAIVVAPSLSDVTLDGLTARALPTDAGTQYRSNCGLYAGRGVTNLVVNNGHFSANTRYFDNNNFSAGALTRCGAGQVFTGNLLEANTNKSAGSGFSASCTAKVAISFRGNRTRGQTSVAVGGEPGYSATDNPRTAAFEADGNRMEGDTGPNAPSNMNVAGFSCSGSMRFALTNNVIFPSLKFDGTDHSNSSRGFYIDLLAGTYSYNCFGEVKNNLIHGGAGVRYTTAIESWTQVPAGESLNFVNNVIHAGLGTGRRDAILLRIWGGSGPEMTFAHNTIFNSSGSLNTDDTLRFLSATWSGYFVRWVNNVFAGSYGKREWLMGYGENPFEGFHNNLIATSSTQLCTYVDNGTRYYTMADLERILCTGNAGGTAKLLVPFNGNKDTPLAPSALFVDPPLETDVTAEQVLARNFKPLASAASVFAIGRDTTKSDCGGDAGQPTACTSVGKKSCGNVTTDKAGAPRPTTNPAVGAYEP